MTYNNKKKRRLVLPRWKMWMLLPLGLFSVFFVDAWLNIQHQLNDYELSKLNVKHRQLEMELAEQTALLAEMKKTERLLEEAEKRGMRSPEMYQFQSVAYRELPRRMPLMVLNAVELGNQDQNPSLTETTQKNLTSPREVREIVLGSKADRSGPKKEEQEHKPQLVMKPYTESSTPTNPVKPHQEEEAVWMMDDPDFHVLSVEDMLAKL